MKNFPQSFIEFRLTIRRLADRQNVSDTCVETGGSSARLVGLVFNSDSLSASEPGRYFRRFLPERVGPFGSLVGNAPTPQRRIIKRGLLHAGYGITKTGPVSDSFLECCGQPPQSLVCGLLLSRKAASVAGGEVGVNIATSQPAALKEPHKEARSRQSTERAASDCAKEWLRDLNGKVYQRVAEKLILRVRCQFLSSILSSPGNRALRIAHQPGTVIRIPPACALS